MNDLRSASQLHAQGRFQDFMLEWGGGGGA